MIGLSRRLLLSGLGAASLRRAVPTLVGGLILIPSTPAQAWVLQAIGIAGSIANMIGGGKSGDGGIGAMLQANHDQMKQVLFDLTNVQSSLGDILQQIQEQGEKFDKILTSHEKLELHRKVLAAAIGYEEVLKGKDPNLSFEEWRQLKTTQSSITNYYHRIREARQLINVSEMVDPATSLVVTSACFVEIGLLILTGAQPSEVRSLVRDVYIPWFEKILDPTTPGSAADYAVSARNRLNEQNKAAGESAFGKAFGLDPGTKLFVCTGVDDFKPERRSTRRVPTGCQDPAEAPSIEKRRFAAGNGSRLSTPDELGGVEPAGIGDVRPAPTDDLSTMPNNGFPKLALPGAFDDYRRRSFRPCITVEDVDPGRNGSHERLARDVVLKEVEAVAYGKPTGLLQLEVALGPDRFGPAGDPALPPDPKCSVERLDMEDAAARMTRMTTSDERRKAEAALTEFQVILAQINLERARAMLGAQAMMAAERSRQRLVEFQEQYK